MKDLHYRAQNENKLPAALVTLFCALALFCLLLASSGLGLSAVFHAFVLLFGALAIFFAFRYYLSYRTYHLTYMAGRQVLTVTDTQGRRITTVFYLYLDEVTDVTLLTRAERRRLPKKDKTFIFSNTLRAKRLLALDAKSELGDIRLILGTDGQFEATFFAAFRERVALARAQEKTDAEEE